MAYNREKQLRENISAIRCALNVDAEKRIASAQERDVLRKYAGFGGLKFILNKAEDPADIQSCVWR